MGIFSRSKSNARTMPEIGDDQFRIMADVIPQLAWMTDQSGAIIWYNQRCYDYTGKTFNSIQGWDWSDVVHPDHKDGVVQRFRDHVSQGLEEWEDTFPLQRHDGEYRWFLSRAIPIRGKDGKVMRWFGTNTDITEQRELEHSLRAEKEKAEIASMAKSEFLANISHEIRTPMNVVIGIANILARSSPLTPKQRQFINTLQGSANSLLALLNDLLDIAKVEAQTIDFEQIPFNLSDLLADITDGMLIKAREKDLDLRFVDECSHADLIGDPSRIRQIITNLCGNALKFTSEGYVEIKAASRLGIGGKHADILIEVKDTGIGIAPSKIDSIFQKFTQADSSISRKFGGTGLGLSISRALIEAMNGHIAVVSTEGKGSTFKIHLHLPVNSADIQTKVIVQGPKERFARGNCILLVEDHAPNILVARTVIEEFGLECDTALNGREALQKLNTRQYLAVLMDVQMPELDGLETTRLWRAHEQEHNLPSMPIIGMTAHAMADDRQKCLDAGMNEYISKPFGFDNLREKLEKFTDILRLKAA